ncbi:flippase [Caballeronia sp. RCC_10]|uniref:flippase n=1 Tax=Caballeronia sp. RCC_10 TaxID=3239227 RepID=UPI0035256033
MKQVAPSQRDAGLNAVQVTATTEAEGNTRLRRNMALMVLSFVGNYAASFATFPYLTRVLGPAHFGLFAFATAVAAYGALFSEWGMSLAGPRAVIACRDDKARLNALIWSVLGAKTLLYVAATFVFVLLLRAGVGGAAAGPALWVSWLGVTANVLTMHWLFQGMERFKLITFMVLISRAVTLPLTFWLVRSPNDVAIAAAIQAAGPFLAAIFSLYIARRDGLVGSPAISLGAVFARIRESADMFVATASVTLFGAANAIILTSHAGPYAAGIYAGADKIRTVCALVPAQLGMVLYPRIGSLFTRRKREASRLTARGAALTIFVSVCGAAISMCFAGSITSIVLGNDFTGAADVLRVLALSTVSGNLAYFAGLQILVPSGASKLRSVVIFAVGCMSVLMSLSLAQRFGALGAATSCLLCETLILIAYIALIAKSRRLRRYLSLCGGVRSSLTIRCLTRNS